jgi:hypothetical protein
MGPMNPTPISRNMAATEGGPRGVRAEAEEAGPRVLKRAAA